MMSAIPGAVLFACNFNRVRSPMAEAIAKRILGDRAFIDSCGLRPREDPVDPFAVVVMAEVGVDLANHQPKTFDQLNDASFDLVISFTPHAQHRAVEMARGRATEIEYWPLQDPTLVEGSREARLCAYREVRDALIEGLSKRFGPRRSSAL
jgi:protein-tyrosine-phosphatase